MYHIKRLGLGLLVFGFIVKKTNRKIAKRKEKDPNKVTTTLRYRIKDASELNRLDQHAINGLELYSKRVWYKPWVKLWYVELNHKFKPIASQCVNFG